MNYVKWHESSTARVSVENFTQVKAQFLFDVQSVIKMKGILSALIVNWGQTANKCIPVSTWTMADERSKNYVADDKRQITAVFAFLIYQGTTTKCLLSLHFPGSFDVTCTENHWSNESTMECSRRHLIPTTRVKCDQCTERILLKPEENNVCIAIIPDYTFQKCTSKYFNYKSFLLANPVTIVLLEQVLGSQRV